MVEVEKGKPIRSYCPQHVSSKYENDRDKEFDSFYITGVDMNIHSEIAVTYSREDVYLFNGTDSFASTHLGPKDLVSQHENQFKGMIYVSRSLTFKGRRNVQTFLKEVAFLGENSYIATGCDSGHLFIWDKKTAELVQLLKV